MTGRMLCVLALVLLLGAAAAEAGSVTFDDQAAFLSATGATNATGPLPSPGNIGLIPVTIGSLTIQSASGNMIIHEWSARLVGNEIAISDVEDMDVTVNLLAPTFSFGFWFVEPEFDPNVNGPFVDSTFSVSLFDGGSFVDSFSYNAPNDTAAFIGVWSTDSFDSIEIRETVGDIGNEFFGEMYTGRIAPASVPIPGSGALALLGMVGLTGLTVLRRKRSR